MASIGNEIRKTFRAAGTVSAYRVLAIDTALSSGFVRVSQFATETMHILGVGQDSATTDQACLVVCGGFAKGAAGASVSAGAILTPVTATGFLIEAGLGGTFATTAFSTVGSVIPKQIGIALQTGSITDAAMEIFVGISNVRVRIA